MKPSLKAIAAVTAICSATAAYSADGVFESFEDGSSVRWDYFTDQVMGGVSEGGARLTSESGKSFARLRGNVSTDNNGGFIQIRRTLARSLPSGTNGLLLDVRGNGEEYYVFLRTTATRRPWHFYKASFPTASSWTEVRLPLSEFESSHSFLPEVIDPESIVSIGLVAYGKDHAADLSVASISLY